MSRRRGHATTYAVACVVALAATAFAAAPARQNLPRTAPAPAPKRVLIVSVDGLRPDVLLRAQAPNLRALMDRGSFTLWARTTEVSVTLPSHVSMLTGVTPERHGVTWNDDRHTANPVFPGVPTLFDLAHAAGMTTALAAGKAKFCAFRRPGSLDWSFVPASGTAGNSEVTERAVRFIAEHRPQVMFVHLPDCDFTGHDYGWGSAQQLAAAADADRCVGRMLAALARTGLLESTVVIVSADHGGAGSHHGAGDVRSRTIPWIAAGPGIRRNLDLTSISTEDVRTEDTFATACAVLGLALPDSLDGRPVRAAFLPAVASQ